MKLGPTLPRGLRWRLTLSYAAVTVMTVLALEVGFLAMVQAWMFGSFDFATLIGGALDNVAPEAAPYLERTSPDATGLQSWLIERMRRTYIRLPFDVDVTDGRNALLAVVGPDGRTLASANPERARIGDNLAARLSPRAASAVRAALTGDIDLTHRAVRDSDGTFTIAAPIVSGGRTLGALVLVPDLMAARATFLGRAAGAILASALALTIFFGAMGTLFGYGWVRWLTGRLRVLTEAVDSWSHGDLDAVAHDASADELGQLARQLNRMAEEIRTLLNAVPGLVVVKDRLLLARDLHDAVKQQVFAVSMQVGAARTLLESDPTAARAHLIEAEQLARQAQTELTTLIHELRPAALTDRGLVAALEGWARDWSRRSGIAAETRFNGARALPLEVEQAVFRLAQEALANVARHSGASHVDVDVAWADDALTLAIEDDGHGFDVDRASGQGLGLTSMRERVQALGGALRLQSSPRGTRVEARLRLKPGPGSATVEESARDTSTTRLAGIQ